MPASSLDRGACYDFRILLSITDSPRRRLVTVVFPALFVPLQLLLFGPHTIYSSNVQEFSAPFWSLVIHLAPMLLGCAAALTVIGVLLPRTLFEYYVVALVALGVALWAQGNLMVGDYGVLNGQDIDWSGQAWRMSVP